VINIIDFTSLVNAEVMFCFQQELTGETLRLIVDSCQFLKKLSLDSVYPILEDADVIYVIKKLGKQLTTLVLDGPLTDAAYLYLSNCPR
jgi:hypothetical protein